jgi:hypothetical protein
MPARPGISPGCAGGLTRRRQPSPSPAQRRNPLLAAGLPATSAGYQKTDCYTGYQHLFPGHLARWCRLRSYLDTAAAHAITALDAISSAAGGAMAGEAGAVPGAARRPLRELMDDRLLDALLERSRDRRARNCTRGDWAMSAGAGCATWRQRFMNGAAVSVPDAAIRNSVSIRRPYAPAMPSIAGPRRPPGQ